MFHWSIFISLLPEHPSIPSYVHYSVRALYVWLSPKTCLRREEEESQQVFCWGGRGGLFLPINSLSLFSFSIYTMYSQWPFHTVLWFLYRRESLATRTKYTVLQASPPLTTCLVPFFFFRFLLHIPSVFSFPWLRRLEEDRGGGKAVESLWQCVVIFSLSSFRQRETSQKLNPLHFTDCISLMCLKLWERSPRRFPPRRS